MRPEKLHPASRVFYEYLLVERPEWLAHSFNVLGYTHREFDLEVVIDPPRGKAIGRLRLPPLELVIWMNDGVEPSVSCGSWHTHAFMNGVDDLPTAAHFRYLLATIDAIISEQSVLQFEYVDEREVGSCCCGRAHLQESLRSSIRAAAEAEPEYRTTRIVLRSWLGTYDREINLEHRRRSRRGPL